ncbi:MFS transporter [Amorphoplanes digitatis]|uniref:MFS family permease n=1 Tax=Actinoplanes digitatis TaxID=1868 RepID=A0A7W7HSI2_9ACTN|nr:MFS transporter [Actinoplanes digitatis]MBB4759943.1 MFS family permease [Actinoplanes digitatis]GID96491.1 MFS transporter [Actinoplanes digitatis]
MTVPDTATAEPTARVGGRWITLLSLANLGLWMAYFGPLQVLLPNQVQQVAGHDKTTVLGIVTGAGALVAVLVGPLAGALSDATTARTGRRHTWIAVGALLGCAGLTLLAAQHTVLGLTLGWCAAQIGLNTLQAGLTAIVPDRAPVRQRGLVSGWIGLTQSIGVVIGVLLVTLVVAGTGGYLLIGVLVVLTAAPFVLATPDPPAAPGTVPRLSARALLGSYRFSLRDNPDFAWAWITRFLVQLGNAMATLYLLYFLRDRVGHPDPDTGLLLLIVVYTAATLLTVVVGGVLSDRTGRRKPSVIVSGYVMAAAAVLLAFWPTWTGALIAAAVLGLGFGVYLSVDQALITQVLPAAQDRARDLGIINIANSAPQVLGPALAFPIVAYLGGYPVLYLTVAAVTVLGSVLVTRIRSVA